MSYSLKPDFYRYIVENPDKFKGKNIVELGSGAGLSGFVASNYGIFFIGY